jgi:hypothetical protein
MKKIHLLPVFNVIAILLISEFLQAQESLPLFLGEKKNPTEYFAKYIGERRLDLLEQANHLDTLCLESICYVRFRVTETGEVLNIMCSAPTPQLIANFLKGMVKSTQGLWKPQQRNGKPVDSTPILLPVYYRIVSKCKEPDKVMPKMLEGFWHIHWFDIPPTYDTTSRGVIYQNDVMEQYIVMHPIRMYIQKSILDR